MLTLQAATTQRTSRTLRKEGAATQGRQGSPTRHPKSLKARNMRKAYSPIAMHKLKNADNWNKRQNMPPAQAWGTLHQQRTASLGPTPSRKLGLTRLATGQTRESFSRCESRVDRHYWSNGQRPRSGGQGHHWSCNSSCTDAKAVDWEVPRDPSCRKDLPQEVCESKVDHWTAETVGQEHCPATKDRPA